MVESAKSLISLQLVAHFTGALAEAAAKELRPSSLRNSLSANVLIRFQPRRRESAFWVPCYNKIQFRWLASATGPMVFLSAGAPHAQRGDVCQRPAECARRQPWVLCHPMRTDDLWPIDPNEAGLASQPSIPSLQMVASVANILKAWDRVRRNNGASGVDGVRIADLQPQFPGLAVQLGESLLRGTYRPRPVLRVEVPKPSGGTRKLGVPTVIDRIVEQAAVQVLQPVFDPHFSKQSFAYRPGRGPLDAVRHIQRRLSRGGGWVLHFDVADFFDSVPHDRVVAVLSEKVADPALAALVRGALVRGVFERGEVLETNQGLAQGSPLSPMLANAVLDGLDRWLDARGAVFARYADDCAVLVDTYAEGELLQGEIGVFLSTLSLSLNSSKTTLKPVPGAEFLGFTFGQGRDGRYQRLISSESFADYGRALGLRLNAAAADGFESRIVSAAQLLQSWLGYYGASEEPAQIDQVRSQTEDALRGSEWRRWPSVAARLRNLKARNVPDDLAARAARANDGEPVVREALLQAYPPAFFREHGLCVPLTTALPRCVDYSGRLSCEIPIGTKPDKSWLPQDWCDWSVRLLETRWLGLSLQLIRCRPALLPRIVSVSLESCGHHIVFHW